MTALAHPLALASAFCAVGCLLSAAYATTERGYDKRVIEDLRQSKAPLFVYACDYDADTGQRFSGAQRLMWIFSTPGGHGFVLTKLRDEDEIVVLRDFAVWGTELGGDINFGPGVQERYAGLLNQQPDFPYRLMLPTTNFIGTILADKTVKPCVVPRPESP